MTPAQHAGGRTPATLGDDVAAYPTLDERGDARRRFLKLCALTSVSGFLGLELVGCPSNGGSAPDSSWVPWDDTRHVAGKMAAPEDAPVALVVGGGPILVVFKDGRQSKLVVAVVVVPRRGQDVTTDVTSKAKQHAELVRNAAKGQASDVLTSAESLGKLEDALRDALNETVVGGYVREVSVGLARPPGSNNKKEAAQEKAAPAKRAAKAAAEPAPAAGKVAPAPQDKLAKVSKIWTPCRRAGCTTCGVK